MKCRACHQKIDPIELDTLDSFYETSPLTFRAGYFHSYCYGVEMEEAKQTPSPSVQYANRYDEYLTKNLQKLSYL